MFGKQANIYLDFVTKMRVSKFFAPHKLSPSTWGTGSWVSENYLFFARAQKFFITIPAITKCKLMLQSDIDFILEYRTILRFITAASASISQIMSSKAIVKDMDCFIKIYMDCMVEMDSNILKFTASETFFWENDKEEGNDKPVKKKKNPNFVKGNSLGILAVARAHEHFGPLLLNWEGGYAGERKMQEVKPLLSIKRENADWEKITLRSHYQLETLTHLLDIMQPSDENESSRDNIGSIKIYGNKAKLVETVGACQPLSGIVDANNDVWIAYRPTGIQFTRSSVTLVQLVFEDGKGENVQDICWMSPIILSENEKEFTSMDQCCKYAIEFLLLLPQLSENGNGFLNKYYVIGHKWTERNSSGRFEWSNLNLDSIFNDWVTIPHDVASL